MNNHIYLQPSYVIHKKPYLNTSLLLSIFTKDHGIINIIAKGARRRSSSLKSVICPFTLLEINYINKPGLCILTDAFITDNIFIPMDKYFLGMYLNELMIKLVHEHDPHEKLFIAYQKALSKLAACSEVEPILREFEISLLQELGYGIDFLNDAHTGNSIEVDEEYYFYPEHGFIKKTRTIDRAKSYLGKNIIAIGKFDYQCDVVRQNAKEILRQGISVRLGDTELTSRKLVVS